MPIVVIPGYSEQLSREHTLREEAFINSPEFVCGVEVVPLTLSKFALLGAIRSPFITAARDALASAEDVALFLWALSPEYGRALRVRGAIECVAPALARLVFWVIRYRFVKRLRKINSGEAIAGIEAYLDRALYDAPRGGGASDSVPYWSSLAGLVCVIASQTGWSETELMNMPTRRVFQYSKIASKLRNPEAILFNPSDSVKSAWARDQMKKKASND